jgi:hypothetical protein
MLLPKEIGKPLPTYRYRSTCGCPILCTVKTGSEAASFINFKPSQERLGYRDRVHHGAIPRQIKRNWREFANFWRDEDLELHFDHAGLLFPIHL